MSESLIPQHLQGYYDRENLEKNHLKKALKTSLIIHSILILCILISTLVFHKQPRILQSSVKVDLVGLPDIKKADLTKAQAADVNELSKKLKEVESDSKDALAKIKKEILKQKELDSEMALKNKTSPKKALKSAIDRIKSLQKIEDSLGKENEKPNKVAAKGNILSKGSSLIGDSSDSFNEYADKMKSRLTENWNLPIWLSKQDLSAQIIINLNKQGLVTSTVFVKPSGNKQFDGYVLRTIQLSQPFGPPPDDIIENGVTLGFPL